MHYILLIKKLNTFHFLINAGRACFLLILFSFVLQKQPYSESNKIQLAFPKTIPLTLRNGPGDFYNIIFIIKNKNLAFNIYHKIDNWCYIQIDEDYKGWVKCASLSTRKKVLAMNCDDYLFRIPGFQKIRKLEKYLKIRIIKCNKNWCRVSVYGKRFLRGWVDKKSILGVN
jgi:SH3-like domain-containing protein